MSLRGRLPDGPVKSVGGSDSSDILLILAWPKYPRR